MSARKPSSSCVTNGASSASTDLFLQPGLLVEADLEVREHAKLCMRLRVALDALALVVREGIAQ